MREIEVIDSELRLLVAIRHMVREKEDQTPRPPRGQMNCSTRARSLRERH